MFSIIKKELTLAGRPLILETGKIARQADGAVLVTYGETVVLCTVVADKKPKPDIDFFPLTVHYQEKAFAAGKIPGGFFKREGRPSEKEVLTSRLIDRPIRPIFADGFRNETQVVCTVLSFDQKNDSDIPALIGASAALSISGIPFEGPIAASRVGYINGEYVLNPTLDILGQSDLDLVVAGTKSSVLMVESEAKELSEEVMLGAVMFGHREMQPVIKAIEEMKSQCGKPVMAVTPAVNQELYNKIATIAEAELRAAYKEKAKQTRHEKINAVSDKIEAAFPEGSGYTSIQIGDAFKKLESDIVRGDILSTKLRIDGRDVTSIRPIQCEIGFLHKTHGSALFTRGETQAMVVTTLGSGDDEQIIDALEGDAKQHFMLHYNFPPYSVGEATPLRAPGRREIGHGKLAWRALRALLPSKEIFPYTMRIVSEITESNGSSSMATVCGSSLAMMDAGIPLKAPVAGIAMGLIKESNKFTVLSDIMGDEDHLGDMDFKVAGTNKGITALQMDIKINGITEEIMKVALSQAKDGRIHILKEMAKAITSPRDTINVNAPRIVTINIPKDKIREVIGSGGKVIRDICEKSGAKVEIEDDGTVKVAGVGTETCEKALAMISDIIAEAEIDKVYEGKVVRIMEFGAIVTFLGAKDGMIHISELADYRVGKVTDVVNEGDVVKVKVIGIERGKVKLSLKDVNQTTGEDISGSFAPRPMKKKRQFVE